MNETPFYATMGGQTADTGVIPHCSNGEFKVEDTIKLRGGKIRSCRPYEKGMIKR